jgi:hypothetical protein
MEMPNLERLNSVHGKEEESSRGRPRTHGRTQGRQEGGIGPRKELDAGGADRQRKEGWGRERRREDDFPDSRPAEKDRSQGGSGQVEEKMRTKDERISIDEAIRRGYIYGQMGYNHATNRRIIAPLETIRMISSGGLHSVPTLDLIRDDQADPEPGGRYSMGGGMRTDDEKGEPCPGTLGEYRDLCAAIGGDKCRAVQFLDEKIAVQGRDEKVVAPDSQMRRLLIPMLLPD